MKGCAKMLSTSTRQAYSELDAFLDLLSIEEKNMIPQQLREYFKREKDPNYVKEITYDEETNSLNLRKDTLALIAFLNLQYWCQDEEEKKRLIAVYKENGKRTRQNVEEQLKNLNKRSENIDIESESSQIESQIVPVKKESLWHKIINKIKLLFVK